MERIEGFIDALTEEEVHVYSRPIKNGPKIFTRQGVFEIQEFIIMRYMRVYVPATSEVRFALVFSQPSQAYVSVMAEYDAIIERMLMP